MADIFISYSKDQPEPTVALSRYLKRIGYSTWWDTRLLSGEQFEARITEEIRGAKYVIVIWTPQSVRSDWVRAEAQLADKLKKLITIRTPDLDYARIPLPFNNRHTDLISERGKIRQALQFYSLNSEIDVLRKTVEDVRKDLDRFVQNANNITNYMYSADKEVGRADILNVSVKYRIAPNGDTQVESLYEIECTTDPAHFWRYWIAADPESSPMANLAGLNIGVKDFETDEILDWLPVINNPLHKEIAIFFPELRSGTKKKIQIAFGWPGYLRKLTENGIADFERSYRSQHIDTPAQIRKEWLFEPGLTRVNCHVTGRRSKTASLCFEKSKATWIYEDTQAMMRGAKASVRFEK